MFIKDGPRLGVGAVCTDFLERVIGNHARPDADLGVLDQFIDARQFLVE